MAKDILKKMNVEFNEIVHYSLHFHDKVHDMNKLFSILFQDLIASQISL